VLAARYWVVVEVGVVGVCIVEGQGVIETKFSVAPRIESAMVIPYRCGAWGEFVHVA